MHLDVHKFLLFYDNDCEYDWEMMRDHECGYDWEAIRQGNLENRNYVDCFKNLELLKYVIKISLYDVETYFGYWNDVSRCLFFLSFFKLLPSSVLLPLSFQCRMPHVEWLGKFGISRVGEDGIKANLGYYLMGKSYKKKCD